MTIEQCENRNKAIIQNALLWAKNQACDILETLDIAVVCEYLRINIPKCMYNFVSTDKIGQVKAYSSHKSIIKFLDKLQTELLKQEEKLNVIL